MIALVTGANGFVGSWLTNTLVKNGWNVKALIKENIPGSIFYSIKDKKLETIKGNVRNFETVRKLFKDIDICFHLAAQPIVTLANATPLDTLETNVRGTYNVLEAARLYDTKVIVASSDKAYGTQKKLPYTENSPLLASHPYDVSKACCDMLTTTYFKTYGLPITITRFCNIFGGGDTNFSRIIPGTIRSIVDNKSPIIRSDGSPVRQYIYIKDVIGAHILLAKKMKSKSISGHAFNFGASKPISALDLVSLILRLAGNTVLKPTILSQARNEIDVQYLSSRKANKLLNWKPKYTLQEGLLETISWYKTFL